MRVGEIIAALASYCANDDDLLMRKDCLEINETDNGNIEIIFTDGNTQDVVIDIFGRRTEHGI